MGVFRKILTVNEFEKVVIFRRLFLLTDKFTKLALSFYSIFTYVDAKKNIYLPNRQDNAEVINT